ncbi:hypothetical protein [Mongoliibacter ruber]|uniref:Uncharacterized protein n=1 Tax=Mongoliibacter ruber TaxID=1750599 RepID=A0A2T0WTG5_9BACT|nr:hypothetical protein [Mongoliibacter ruber]PRY89968.1 hypothetical protein CLW00_102446 [Mongoliibacter ruber]
MNKSQQHINIWKQRVSLILVLAFCMLVTGAEYVQTPNPETNSEQKDYSEDQSDNSESQTFLNVAVDAVVPFVTVVGQQIFYLIYENLKIEKINVSGPALSLPVNLPYWEILLERIISPNAP